MPSTVCIADFDLATRSASGFILRHIVPRTVTPPLYQLLARRPPFSLASQRSDFILGMGHGLADRFTGQNEELILKVGEYNPKQVEGKVIKLLSCQTGIELGPDLVRNGAAAFLGYSEDFVWIMDADRASSPWSDPYAGWVLKPVIDGVQALLDGATVQEAYDVEIEGYERGIDETEDDLVRSCLEFNARHAVLFGDSQARIKPRPHFVLPFPPPPILFPLNS